MINVDKDGQWCKPLPLVGSHHNIWFQVNFFTLELPTDSKNSSRVHVVNPLTGSAQILMVVQVGSTLNLSVVGYLIFRVSASFLHFGVHFRFGISAKSCP